MDTILELLHMPVVTRAINTLFEFIAEFGGGRGHLYDDLARFTLMGAMFFVAYLISKHPNESKKYKEPYLTTGFGIGLARASILFICTTAKIICLDVLQYQPDTVAYYFSFFQPTIDHTLNFLCTGILSLSLMGYVTSNIDSVENYIKQVYRIGITSAVITVFYFTMELLVAGRALEGESPVCLYWHGATFIVVLMPTLRLLHHKANWLRNVVLLITCCWLFYDLSRVIDILSSNAYTSYVTPLRNMVYNFSIPIFIYIYLKDLFINLEYTTNEAKLLASDREFIIKGFSHEIRTPLMALSGFLKAYDLTNKKYNDSLDEESKEKLKRGCPKGLFCNRIVDEGVPEMRAGVTYISNIIDNLSEYGRESSRQAVGKFELTSLTGVGVKYAKFTDEAKLIPSSSIICLPIDRDVHVNISPSKYLQIIQNLLRNAIRATSMDKNKEPRIMVETELSADGKECTVCVNDNGIGMSKEQVGRCTEKYWTTKKDNTIKTSGLGLYFVKMYMDDFGGRMVIDSQLGVGTNICLIFKIIA